MRAVWSNGGAATCRTVTGVVRRKKPFGLHHRGYGHGTVLWIKAVASRTARDAYVYTAPYSPQEFYSSLAGAMLSAFANSSAKSPSRVSWKKPKKWIAKNLRKSLTICVRKTRHYDEHDSPATCRLVGRKRRGLRNFLLGAGRSHLSASSASSSLLTQLGELLPAGRLVRRRYRPRSSHDRLARLVALHRFFCAARVSGSSHPSLSAFSAAHKQNPSRTK